MTITPQQKQLLSGLAVAIAGAILTALNAYVIKLPEGWQGIAGAVLAGVAHYLPALGTKDVIDEKVQTKVTAIVSGQP